MTLLIVILVILFQNSMCKGRCVCGCVAVNSPARYIWIVNYMTDSETCLFPV